MKRLLIAHCSLLIFLGLLTSGCVIRTIPYIHERVDQSQEGNRGYLMGTPPSEKKEERPPRQMFNIEIELPPHGFYEQKDNDLSGNRGYIVGAPQPQKKASTAKEEKPSLLKLRPETYVQPSVQPRLWITETKPVVRQGLPHVEAAVGKEKKLIERYVVQKGDTLQKIAAKDEIYGDWRNWEKLFEANKEKIKDPDKIRAGMELVIPRD